MRRGISFGRKGYQSRIMLEGLWHQDGRFSTKLTARVVHVHISTRKIEQCAESDELHTAIQQHEDGSMRSPIGQVSQERPPRKDRNLIHHG